MEREAIGNVPSRVSTAWQRGHGVRDDGARADALSLDVDIGWNGPMIARPQLFRNRGVLRTGS